MDKIKKGEENQKNAAKSRPVTGEGVRKVLTTALTQEPRILPLHFVPSVPQKLTSPFKEGGTNEV